tara:strand:+ start:3799 stop:4647 length:849 start_codon:yes stop_codon:yes gene_type:complete
MIYDRVISTGDVNISGCSSLELATDTFGSGNLIAAGTKNVYYYDIDLVTGQRSIQLAVNGQTFLQEVPITGQATNFIDYQINTGDFFIKGAESSVTDRSQLYFTNNSPVKSNSKLQYNVITGGNIAGTGDFGESLTGSILNGIGSVVFSDCEYFLNGQKMYSGMGVGCSAGTDGTSFVPLFGGAGSEAANVGGIVTTANKNKFKYTVYSKKPRTASLTGISPDVFSSTGFLEGRTIFYINGIQQSQESYLELYTGVTIIKKDIAASISGSSINQGTLTSLSL